MVAALVAGIYLLLTPVVTGWPGLPWLDGGWWTADRAMVLSQFMLIAGALATVAVGAAALRQGREALEAERVEREKADRRLLEQTEALELAQARSDANRLRVLCSAEPAVISDADERSWLVSEGVGDLLAIEVVLEATQDCLLTELTVEPARVGVLDGSRTDRCSASTSVSLLPILRSGDVYRFEFWCAADPGHVLSMRGLLAGGRFLARWQISIGMPVNALVSSVEIVKVDAAGEQEVGP